MVLFQRNLYFPRILRGSNISQGCPTFLQGVQMLISIETLITCDFPGGGGVRAPILPLDPRMNST